MYITVSRTLRRLDEVQRRVYVLRESSRRSLRQHRRLSTPHTFGTHQLINRKLAGTEKVIVSCHLDLDNKSNHDNRINSKLERHKAQIRHDIQRDGF